MDYRVMIVDDDENIRDTVAIMFLARGIKITAASGGDECLGCLEAGFRGVLLMDVMMPHMDGWETVSQIVERGLYDGNVIVMLTAMSEPGIKMEKIQEYVTDYISKPFNPVELFEAVKFYATLLKAEEPYHAEP